MLLKPTLLLALIIVVTILPSKSLPTELRAKQPDGRPGGIAAGHPSGTPDGGSTGLPAGHHSVIADGCSAGVPAGHHSVIADGGAAGIPDALHATTKIAVIGDKRLAYRSVGTGMPLVLCNRFRGNLDSWDPSFLDALGKYFRVIIFDYTGIGRSSGQLPLKIASVAEDVRDLATFLQLGKFVIGGWSYGGIVAQTFTGLYPQSITHTVLIGTNPPGKNNHPPEQVFLETSAKTVNDLDDETILFFEPASASSRKAARLSHDRIMMRRADLDSVVTPDKFERYSKSTADFAADEFNLRVKLGQLETPVLSISGDHDCVCPVENWYALTRQMKNLQIVMFPESGHGPQHQYVQASVETIRNFVRLAGKLQ